MYPLGSFWVRYHSVGSVNTVSNFIALVCVHLLWQQCLHSPTPSFLNSCFTPAFWRVLAIFFLSSIHFDCGWISRRVWSVVVFVFPRLSYTWSYTSDFPLCMKRLFLFCTRICLSLIPISYIQPVDEPHWLSCLFDKTFLIHLSCFSIGLCIARMRKWTPLLPPQMESLHVI